MKTNEKFAMLNAVVIAAEMNEKEIREWFEARQTTSKPKSTGGIKSIFPIVYKKGNDFEILPELDLARKDEVWGYEIVPGIVLAKKCGADNNVESTAWDNVREFAEQCRLDGKQGKLPSEKVLAENWSQELRENIQKMDAFLCEKGIDAETEYLGAIWCSEAFARNNAYIFSLNSSRGNWIDKNLNTRYDRVAVAF